MDFKAFVEKQEKRRRPWLFPLQVEKHLGPGPHPSGSPQSAHAGGKGGIQVGITSALPGRTIKQIREEMAEFHSLMKKTPVKNLSVQLGTGGWEGGSEPTFVTQFEGDGEARKILAAKAKEWDQQAVIIMQHVKKGGQPQSRISFGEALSEEEYRAVEAGLLESSRHHKANIGGWTWGKGKSGRPELIVQCIPQWGGNPKRQEAAMRDLAEELNKTGYKISQSKLRAKVEIWEKEVGDYDRVLAE